MIFVDNRLVKIIYFKVYTVRNMLIFLRKELNYIILFQELIVKKQQLYIKSLFC